MNLFNRYHIYCALLVLCSIGIIVFIINGISISYKEALIYFDNSTLIAKLAHLSVNLFGQNDYALRLPNIIFHTLNLALIYLISNKILKHQRDSILCVLIFALIPGVIMQGTLLNESLIMLFVVLLICYLEIKQSKFIYSLFIIAIFVSSSAFMFFLAFFFYSLSNKHNKRAAFALLLFSINLYIYGIDISGKPSGRFLAVISELALLYSPPLFIYYVYTLYRNVAERKYSLLLFISVTSLLISFILSIRQGVNKEVFLFMSLCGIPLMIRQFLSDIRVRLPRFQNAYKNRFIIVLVFLIIEALLLIFPKSLYLVAKSPNDMFLNSFYIAKELSEELKNRNISRVNIDDKRMQTRLAFYGINSGGQKLRKVSKNGNIAIRYYGVVVARYAI